MVEITEDFFSGKRSWSLIKDKVLDDYMSAYLPKVSTLGRQILLIDAYAGPGIFEDGRPGSPVIMCQKAEKYVKGRYASIFINKDEKYHKKLEAVLQKERWSDSARPYLADSRQLLQLIPSVLKDQTVFLYLDPFGLNGCEFALLEPFLKRDLKLSTEILLTMNMPVVHRLAACNKSDLQDNGRIRSYRERLTKVFGGDYWKDILCQPAMTAADKETQLIEAYQTKLKQYLPFSGSCPVRERITKRIKYFIVFASRHPDSIYLLNDIMAEAYFGGMHKAEYTSTLFEEISWRDMPSLVTQPAEKLDEVILKAVLSKPGATRKDIWINIIQKYFMRYMRSDFTRTVQKLVDEQKLVCPTPRRSRLLNDNCQLYTPSI